jgi:hypothetical protein
MFRIDRETARSFWAHLNAKHSIESDDWWQAYYEKQLSFSTEKPWLYGTEECLFEEWLNEEIAKGFKFEQFPESVHSVHLEHDPIFMHYYGPRKSEYPLPG